MTGPLLSACKPRTDQERHRSMTALTITAEQHPAFPITLYGRPDNMCFGCKKTKQAFKDAGVQFRYVDLTDDANAGDLEALRALGVQQVPYVITPEGEWMGLDKAKIDAATAGYRAAVEAAQ